MHAGICKYVSGDTWGCRRRHRHHHHQHQHKHQHHHHPCHNPPNPPYSPNPPQHAVGVQSERTEIGSGRNLKVQAKSAVCKW